MSRSNVFSILARLYTITGIKSGSLALPRQIAIVLGYRHYHRHQHYYHQHRRKLFYSHSIMLPAWRQFTCRRCRIAQCWPPVTAYLALCLSKARIPITAIMVSAAQIAPSQHHYLHPPCLRLQSTLRLMTTLRNRHPTPCRHGGPGESRTPSRGRAIGNKRLIPGL